MVGINTKRRSREEALRRRSHRQRAERLDSLKGSFADFMNKQGLTDSQRSEEMANLEDIVDFHDAMAEEGDVD